MATAQAIDLTNDDNGDDFDFNDFRTTWSAQQPDTAPAPDVVDLTQGEGATELARGPVTSSSSPSRAQANDPGQRPWLRTPLDPSRPCIRVLVLRRGVESDTIHVNLRVVDLDQRPEYETLSYVWGDANKTRQITVDGVAFEATVNLYDFLHCLRRPSADRTVWADAICIHQNNGAEKMHQIGLMDRIYMKARQAHIWFGHFTSNWSQEISADGYIPSKDIDARLWLEAEREYETALKVHTAVNGPVYAENEIDRYADLTEQELLFHVLEILDKLSQGTHLPKFPLFVWEDKSSQAEPLKRKPVMNTHWWTIIDCIQWLLSRPWWDRVWTLQEAVLPRVDPLIHIGSDSVRLSRITRACHKLADHVQTCCKEHRFIFLREWDSEHQRSFFIRAGHVENFRSTLAKSGVNKISYEDAIRSSLDRQATHVRDRTFGMLGLLRHRWNGHFQKLSYDIDAGSLYSQFSKAFYGSENLNLLWLATGLESGATPNLPSWAIDFGRYRALSGGGGMRNSVSTQRWACFNASLDTPHKAPRVSDLPGLFMTVDSIYVGTVGAVQNRQHYGNGLIEQIEMRELLHDCRKLYGELADFDEDRFWRTVFFDRNVKWYWRHQRRGPMPLERMTYVKRWWRNYERTRDIRDVDLDTKTHTRGTYHWREAHLNSDHNRFFVTGEGDPGLGHPNVQPGDEIHVLAGARSLAVLRPPEHDDERGHRWVGFCFVDGYMYGEALRKTTPVPWKKLELR